LIGATDEARKKGQSTILALRCLEWVSAKGNRKLQRSFEQRAAKVSKENVLRRSEIIIAPHPTSG
jgi:hypothetical protein